ARHATASRAGAGALARTQAGAPRRALHRPRRPGREPGRQPFSATRCRRRHRRTGDPRSRPGRRSDHANGGRAPRSAVDGCARQRRDQAAISRADGAGLMFLRTAFLVLKKDFAIELRSYEILSTTMLFAVSCVAIFSFAFVREGEAPKDAAAGI